MTNIVKKVNYMLNATLYSTAVKANVFKQHGIHCTYIQLYTTVSYSVLTAIRETILQLINVIT